MVFKNNKIKIERGGRRKIGRDKRMLFTTDKTSGGSENIISTSKATKRIFKLKKGECREKGGS